MKQLFTIVYTLLVAFGAASSPCEPHCQKVTSTAEVCSTCKQLACLALKTITQYTDCPSPVPTATVSYPCSKSKCPGGCMSTSYIIVPPKPTPQPSCQTVTTKSICSTCIMPDCLGVVTITPRDGCPMPPVTKREEYPCGGACPTGCADTTYITLATPYAGK